MFVVAGGNRAPLFESVEGAFHDVAQLVDVSVEAGTATGRPFDLRWAIWSLRCGMTARMPRARNRMRVDACEYALSAISTCGRHRGRAPVGTAIASMTGINCGLSPACPAVSTTLSSRPLPSTAACALVVQPHASGLKHDHPVRARNSCNSIQPLFGIWRPAAC